MEKLRLKYATTIKAYAQLGIILEEAKAQKAQNAPPTTLIVYRDSVIKRFDFCYDLTWKYLKLYLEVKFGVLVTSPKMTFHEAKKQSILSEEQTALALAMIDDRNESSHTYDEERAVKIANHIPTYFSLMQIIAQRCEPS